MLCFKSKIFNTIKFYIVFLCPMFLYPQAITSDLEFINIPNVGFTFQSVPLTNTYTDPIVVCTYVLPSSSDNEVVVRIDNLSATSFDVKIQRPNNSSAVTPGDVHCLISDEGNYTVPFTYEAHKVVSTGTNGRNAPNDWTLANAQEVTSSILNTYGNRVTVLGQVMTFNDNRFSSFWSFNCVQRNRRPFQSVARMCVGKNVGEVGQSRSNETLGYIVADDGIYELANFNMEVNRGSNSITGVGTLPTPNSYALDKTYDFAIATGMGMNNNQGGWVEMYGANPLAGSQIDLTFDEETVAGDSSRSHPNEEIGYWAINSFAKTYADMVINEIMYRSATSGTANEEFVEFYVTSSGSIQNFLFTDQDGSAREYLFPDVSVSTGDYVVLHMGTGVDSSSGGIHHFYMGVNPILNNNGDDVVLLKPSNTDGTIINGSLRHAIPVDYVSYFVSGGGVDPVPVSINGVTVPWNTSEQNRIAQAPSLTSISLTVNGDDTDTSLCWEHTATTNAARKATNCTDYIQTRDRNTGAGLTDSVGISNTEIPNLADMVINEIMYRQLDIHITSPLNEEFIEFYVTKDGTIKDFILSDQDGTVNEYHFPDLNVSVGDYVILHSGAGTDSSSAGIHHFYMGLDWTLDNVGDDITLLKPIDNDFTTINGNRYRVFPVDYVAYFGSSSGSIDSVPVSEGSVTVPWNTSEQPRLGGADELVSISLSPNSTDSDTSLCWEWTATTDVSRQALNCTGYKPTNDINTNAGFIDSEAFSNTDLPILADMNINEIMYRQTADGPANEEFIEFYVSSSGSIINFILSDQDGTANEYHFPNLSVSAGDYVILHSGVGTDSSGGGVHHFYMGTNWTLNNTGDDITLLKPAINDFTTINGNRYRVVPVDYVSYFVSSTTAIDPIPVSEGSVTVSWDITEYARLGGAAILTSISLTPNATDSDTSLCWEWTATTLPAQKATNCSGYIPTRDTNTNPGFIDSVTVSNTDGNPNIILSKYSSTIYDPVNLLVNPKSIPGAIKEYTIESNNTGIGAVDVNTTRIFDAVPVNMSMCVSNTIECKTPVFVDGTNSSGLTLGVVSYSDNGGLTYVYTASPDANGVDDNVTNIRINLNGTFSASDGINHPNFRLKLRMRVK